MKRRYFPSLFLALSCAVSGLAVAVTGCAGDRSNRSTGQYIDDKTLELRVARAIHEDGHYKLGDVQVRSFRSTIHLSGFVNTEQQKARAAEIAKNYKGVRNVENNISVKIGLTDTR